MAAKASLTLLGPFVLSVDGQAELSLPRRVQGLLAVLALRGGQALTREVLADMLWTRSGPDEARQSLRQALVVARKALGDGIIQANGGLLAIPATGVAVDALDFERLAASGTRDDLARCAALYRGELLQNLASVSARFDEWLAAERARLAGVAAAVYRRLAEAHAAAGDFDAAVPIAQRLVALDDLNEDAQRLLMRLLARVGKRGEALRQYDSFAAILKVELGVAPEPATVELVRSIRKGGDAPVRGEAVLPEPDVALISPPARQRVRSRGWRLSGALALVGVAVVMAVATLHPAALPTPRRLVIAPFADLSAGSSEGVAIDGLGDLIAVHLQETQSLRTALYPRDRAARIAARDIPKTDPAAEYVLEGSAALSTSLDLDLRLTDRGGVERWSNHYRTSIGEILGVTADVAAHVARAVSDDGTVLRNSGEPIETTPAQIRQITNLAVVVRYPGTEAASKGFRDVIHWIVMRQPDDPPALGLLANAYLDDFMTDGRSDTLGEAGRLLDHALEVEPTNLSALWDKCFLRRLQHRIDDALEVCRRVIDLSPHHAGAMREIAHDLMALGDYRGAIGWFQAAIDAAPLHPYVSDAYFGIAVCEYLLGHTEKAIALGRESLSRDRSGNIIGLWLATVLEIEGRRAEAQSALDEFYRHHPEFPQASTAPARIIRMLSPEAERTFAAMRSLGVPDIETH